MNVGYENKQKKFYIDKDLNYLNNVVHRKSNVERNKKLENRIHEKIKKFQYVRASKDFMVYFTVVQVIVCDFINVKPLNEMVENLLLVCRANEKQSVESVKNKNTIDRTLKCSKVDSPRLSRVVRLNETGHILKGKKRDAIEEAERNRTPARPAVKLQRKKNIAFTDLESKVLYAVHWMIHCIRYANGLPVDPLGRESKLVMLQWRRGVANGRSMQLLNGPSVHVATHFSLIMLVQEAVLQQISLCSADFAKIIQNCWLEWFQHMMPWVDRKVQNLKMELDNKKENEKLMVQIKHNIAEIERDNGPQLREQALIKKIHLLKDKVAKAKKEEDFLRTIFEQIHECVAKLGPDCKKKVWVDTEKTEHVVIELGAGSGLLASKNLNHLQDMYQLLHAYRRHYGCTPKDDDVHLLVEKEILQCFGMMDNILKLKMVHAGTQVDEHAFRHKTITARKSGLRGYSALGVSKHLLVTSIASSEVEFEFASLSNLPKHLYEQIVLLRRSYSGKLIRNDVVLQLIGQIYDEYSKLLNYSELHPVEPSTFSEFIYEYFLLKHGVPKLAETNFATFCLSIQWTTTSARIAATPEIQRFASFLQIGNAIPNDGLFMFLFSRKHFKNTGVSNCITSTSTTINRTEQHLENEYHFDSTGNAVDCLLDTAFDLIKVLFQERKSIQVENLCESCFEASKPIVLVTGSTVSVVRKHTRAISIEQCLSILLNKWITWQDEAFQILRVAYCGGATNQDERIQYDEFISNINIGVVNNTHALSICYAKALETAKLNESSPDGSVELSKLLRTMKDLISVYTEFPDSWAQANKIILSKLVRHYGLPNFNMKITISSELNERFSNVRHQTTVIKQKISRDAVASDDHDGTAYAKSVIQMRLCRLEFLVNAEKLPEASHAYRLLLHELGRFRYVLDQASILRRTSIVEPFVHPQLLRAATEHVPRPPAMTGKQRRFARIKRQSTFSKSSSTNATIDHPLSSRRRSRSDRTIRRRKTQRTSDVFTAAYLSELIE